MFGKTKKSPQKASNEVPRPIQEEVEPIEAEEIPTNDGIEEETEEEEQKQDEVTFEMILTAINVLEQRVQAVESVLFRIKNVI